ncbi:uracil-DNA glycosylase [Undibacterium sp. SXout7W]|uniref:uracil-DNA glycosylase n=1 Tax=Undibacterium sp. SXout7W TaxID=3413049 RepID=UPI003BF2781C
MSSLFEQSGERSHLLREMGLGPMWQLREPELQAKTEAAIAVPVPVFSLVESASVPAPVSAHLPEKDINAPPATAINAELPEMPDVSDVSAIPEITASSLVPGFATPLPEQAQAIVVQQGKTPVEQMTWDELQLAVSECQACNLCHSRKNTVFGVGDRKADWMFVGEGPGYNENIQGKPFVGAAGQLLDNMLRSLGLQRDRRTFIANIVKCRPTDEHGKDRPPTADEVAACLPYLHRQIELIQPQMIVALGKTAAVSLLGMSPETPVGQLREKTHRYQAIPVVVTYHPAYLLRKPADKRKAWADLCMATALVPGHHT